jgi:predicted aconitase with swiveling domain
MNGKKIFRCRKIADGVARGPVLISHDSICFYMVSPDTGIIVEQDHAALGQSIAGKVIIFPSGKGSSVVQMDGLYKLQLKGFQPKAMIIEKAETVLVATAIILRIPLVDRVDAAFYEAVVNGDMVEVDASQEVVRLIDKTSEIG